MIFDKTMVRCKRVGTSGCTGFECSEQLKRIETNSIKPYIVECHPANDYFPKTMSFQKFNTTIVDAIRDDK